MKKLGKIGVVIAVFVAMLVFAGATMAFTQTPDAATSEGALAPVADLVQRVGFGPGRGRGPDIIDREAMQEVVAEALGISVEELEAAREEGTSVAELAEELGVDMDDVRAAVYEATVAAVEQAVADGELTEEQADEILARLELKQLAAEIFSKEDAQAVVAETLGLTVEELEAAHDEGTRLSELAEEQGVDLADIRDAVEAARAEAIEQAVEDGLITQEQADELDDLCGFGGHGRRGGRGRGGNFGGPEGDFEAPTTPEGTSA